MPEIDDSPSPARTAPCRGADQGQLFANLQSEPPEPARNAILDPRDPSRIIETLDTLDPELDTCVGRRHRHRRGETVKVQVRPRGRVDGVTAEIRPGEWGDGVVLTERFDLDRRHVGWVGVPGTTVMWRRLCGLAHGDDAELARARQRAEDAGIVVRVRVL